VEDSKVFLELDNGQSLELGRVTAISAPTAATAGA
jgi:hypothetical protein